MGQQQGRHGHGGSGALNADQHGQGAQSGHGGPGQDALEIALAQGQGHAPGGGDGASGHQHRGPQGVVVKRWVQARHQVDAQLHHGGRVQVGRHRGGRGHGVGQPEVEGELRALGEAADHDQQHGRGQSRAVGQLRHGLQQLGDLVGAGHVAQGQDTRQQHQAPRAGHQQGLLGRFTAFFVLVVEAHQQERGQAGQLPEHEQEDQVISRDTPDHGQHEQGQQDVEPVLRRVPGQVATRVNEHRCAHAGDHQQEQGRQAVDAPRGGDASGIHPRKTAREGQVVLQQQPAQRAERGQWQQSERCAGHGAQARVRIVVRVRRRHSLQA